MIECCRRYNITLPATPAALKPEIPFFHIAGSKLHVELQTLTGKQIRLHGKKKPRHGIDLDRHGSSPLCEVQDITQGLEAVEAPLRTHHGSVRKRRKSTFHHVDGLWFDMYIRIENKRHRCFAHCDTDVPCP